MTNTYGSQDDEEEEGLDPSVDWDAKDRQALDIGKKMLAQVAGAGLGLVVAGPVGALVGAGAVPLLELMAHGQDRALERVGRLSDEITALSGLSMNDFAAWARATEQRQALTLAAVHAAFNAANQRKLIGLARILADNVKDDRHIYVSTLIVKALADMEEPHILALAALVLEDLPRDPSWNLRAEGYAQVQLERRFPSFAAGILQILATFEAHGLVRDGTPVADDNKAGRVTAFGRRCLAYLQDYPIPPDADVDAT